MKKDYLLNIVAFCILMENDKGIIDKSPEYVMEKFRRYIGTENEGAHEFGLDFNNNKKLVDYKYKWIKK